jgi:hypothetical protein
MIRIAEVLGAECTLIFPILAVLPFHVSGKQNSEDAAESLKLTFDKAISQEFGSGINHRRS